MVNTASSAGSLNALTLRSTPAEPQWEHWYHLLGALKSVSLVKGHDRGTVPHRDRGKMMLENPGDLINPNYNLKSVVIVETHRCCCSCEANAPGSATICATKPGRVGRRGRPGIQRAARTHFAYDCVGEKGDREGPREVAIGPGESEWMKWIRCASPNNLVRNLQVDPRMRMAHSSLLEKGSPVVVLLGVY